MGKRLVVLEQNNVPRLSDQRVLWAVHFVRPRGLVPIRLWVRWDPLGTYHGWTYAGADPPQVRVVLPIGGTFPTKDVSPTRRGLSWGTLRTRTEALICLLAHELYHVRQQQRNELMDERSADLYALRMLHRFRHP